MSEPAQPELLLRAVAEARREAALVDLPDVRKRLQASGGGVEVAYASAALEIRVEVLNSPGRLERCVLNAAMRCTSLSTGAGSSARRVGTR